MRRRKRNPETNAERLKRLYAVGKLTLDAFMEQIDAQLAAGTLDDAAPDPYRGALFRSALSPEYYGLVYANRSPADVAERWRAGVSGAAPSWTAPRARDTLAGSTDE